MSRFGITNTKENALIKRMESLGISEEDLTESFIRGSGAGGQKINKTSSCVQLCHQTYGIEVRCQKSRSQALNRYYARVILCEKVDLKLNAAKSKKQQEIEKIKRQKRKRSKRAKEKILGDKKAASSKKQMRKKPDHE